MSHAVTAFVTWIISEMDMENFHCSEIRYRFYWLIANEILERVEIRVSNEQSSKSLRKSTSTFDFVTLAQFPGFGIFSKIYG